MLIEGCEPVNVHIFADQPHPDKGMSLCRVCDNYKESAKFRVRQDKPDGIDTECRECAQIREGKSRAKHEAANTTEARKRRFSAAYERMKKAQGE